MSCYKAATLSLCHELPKNLIGLSRLFRSLTLVFVLVPISAAADVWELKGSLGQQLQYNDNIALTSSSQQAVFGYFLTPILQASRKMGALDVDFVGQGDIRRYDASSWDCDNYIFGLNSAYRTDRSSFALRGGYGVSCSYSQQITDTGILVPASQTQNFRIAPSWTWQWMPRTQLIVNSSYSKTSYGSSGGSTSSTTFSGNETYLVSLGGNYMWNPRLSLNGTVTFSSIQYTDASAGTTNFYGFQFGGNYLINQKWTVSATGGPRIVNTQQQSSGSSTLQNTSMVLGYVANINLSFIGERIRLSTGFSSAISPSGIGQTLQNQAVFFNYSYHIKKNLSLDLSSNFTNSQSIGVQASSNPTGSFNRDYFTATVGLAWQIATDWQLKGNYLYRWQHYPQQGTSQSLSSETAESNTVMLSLNYAWDGISNSR